MVLIRMLPAHRLPACAPENEGSGLPSPFTLTELINITNVF